MKTTYQFFAYCTLLALALSPQQTQAQGTTFGEQQIIEYSETNSPQEIYTADLDDDGDMDVLSASFDDDKIAWYENDGIGNFGIQQIISVAADGASSVYASDLDGDGDMDVLSASSEDNKIAWYENDGIGNFGIQQIISVAADGASSVYASDLDGDGDMDVLRASYYGIVWHENDGMGNFGAQTITSAYIATSVYASDLDGDGDLDVLLASANDNKIAWCENDGIGNFGAQQIISTNANDAQSVYASDLDGDGDIDVLSASSEDSKIAWYENDGIGNFSTQQIITTAAAAAQSVYTGDLDGDGDMDVLSASNNDSKIAWYKNNGIGNFTAQPIITNTAYGAQSVHASDLDGDGDIDVLSASEQDNKIAQYENNGMGNFGAQQIINTAIYVAYDVYASDLDGDGDKDALSVFFYDNKIVWYENDGMGNFGAQQIITTNADGAESVYTSDLDGDGDMDVLSASREDSKIAWYENDGMGNFVGEQIITIAATGAQDVYASDLDGDGDMDVLSASYVDDKIAWYENDGMGNFGAQQIISTIANDARSVYASDLDGDGDMDVLSASFWDDKIAWYENDGMGNFGSQQIITTVADYAYSVYASDLDGDGDMDVLSASYGDDKIAWYENDGMGNFGAQQIITTAANSPRAIYASDLDGDGDIDVLSASRSDDKIAWYANDGMGNFGAQQIITTAADGANSVYASDLDGDGDIDVLSASELDDKIAWYENLLNDPKISGAVFYDTNQNGVLDSGEFGMDYQNVSINPNSSHSYTNSSGLFVYYLDAAGTYSLNYTAPTGWTATTPTTLNISIATGGSSVNNNFGIYPNTVTPNIKPYLGSAINRCNWVVPYYLNVINEGTTIEPLSVVSLKPDPQLTYVSASLAPDSIGAQGWLYWHINNLLPAQQRQITVLFQMPDFSAMGDTLTSIALVNSYNNAGALTDNNSFGYRTVVVCSYDPNDKQVHPLGIGEQNYTLINDEELLYTIRFQNTGNDTAFNIIVADTLSQHLDHSTFRPITSSHQMQVLRQQSGLVEFKFDNILLPDSATNEAGSHGYIMYGIKAKTPVLDNTPINNTAYIYFDFNPAIVTNTTTNLMVYEIPGNITLPISLLYFTANKQGKDNLIRWATASETNNDKFVLWRSTNGIDFMPIATLAAKGNSHTTQYYQYLDNAMQQGIIYYRLQWIDYNGKEQNSQVIALDREGNIIASQPITCYPNPAKDQIYLQQASPQIAHYTLHNTLGETLAKGSFNTATYTLPVAHLPQGLYYLNVNGNTFKVVKE
jgi:hypothetical protein